MFIVVNIENLRPLIEDQEHLIFNKQLELYEINLKLSKLELVTRRLKLSINGSIRAKNNPRAQYYKYLLKSKNVCITEYAKVKTTKLNELGMLSTELCKHKTTYECKKSLLQDFEINSTMMEQLQSKLDKLQEDVTKIEQQQILFVKHQDKLGIKGDQYIKFLLYLRQLVKAIKDGCNAYAPIISILNGKTTP